MLAIAAAAALEFVTLDNGVASPVPAELVAPKETAVAVVDVEARREK